MATHTAVDVTFPEVNNALGLCSAGDTLIVPTGTATWTSTLTVTIPILILGSDGTILSDASKGTDATTVISAANNRELIIISSATDAPIRVSGFKFNYASFTTSGGASAVQIRGSGVSGGNHSLTKVRVDHNWFVFGTRTFQPQGFVYGVADHNTGTNNNIFFGPIGDSTPAWSRTLALGDANTMFFETNSGLVTNGAAAGVSEIVYLQDGVRACVRNNLFDGSTHTNEQWSPFDTHGNQQNLIPPNVDPLLIRGQPTYEFYNNTVSMFSFYRMMYVRGGLCAFHDNAITYTSGGAGHVWEVTEEDGWQTAFFDPLMTVWPGRDQAQLFHWSNTLNTVAITGFDVQNATDTSTFVFSGRDVFNRAPQTGDTYLAWQSGYSGTTTISVNLTNYSAYPYPFSFTQFASAAVDGAGTSLTVNWSVNATSGTGGSAGMTITASGGAVTATYVSGSGSTAYVYSLNRAIQAGETMTLAYVQPAAGIQDTILKTDTPSFASKPVTNGSTQGGNSVTGTAGKVTLVGRVSIL